MGVYFNGRLAGAQGAMQDMYDRRTVRMKKGFTIEEAKAEVAKALSYADGKSPAYQDIRVTQVTFN
jgi:hypothetical protein